MQWGGGVMEPGNSYLGAILINTYSDFPQFPQNHGGIIISNRSRPPLSTYFNSSFISHPSILHYVVWATGSVVKYTINNTRRSGKNESPIFLWYDTDRTEKEKIRRNTQTVRCLAKNGEDTESKAISWAQKIWGTHRHADKQQSVLISLINLKNERDTQIDRQI
jgi:hypothetical protein